MPCARLQGIPCTHKKNKSPAVSNATGSRVCLAGHFCNRTSLSPLRSRLPFWCASCLHCGALILTFHETSLYVLCAARPQAVAKRFFTHNSSCICSVPFVAESFYAAQNMFSQATGSCKTFLRWQQFCTCGVPPCSAQLFYTP